MLFRQVLPGFGSRRLPILAGFGKIINVLEYTIWLSGKRFPTDLVESQDVSTHAHTHTL